MGAEATGTAGAGTTVIPPVVTPPVVTPPVVTPPAATPPAEPVPPAEPTTPGKTSVVTDAPENPETPKTPETPKAPEKYELALPEDTLLDEGAIERTVAYAKEQGLSNDAAQEFLNEHSQAVADHVDAQSETWASEIDTDAEIGGKKRGESVEMARRVVTRFGTDDFKQLMVKFGYGNHKEVVRIFSRIGKAMGEDKLVHAPTAGAKGKPKSKADILYGEGPVIEQTITEE